MVIGGLLSSTLITLILVPTIYLIIEEKSLAGSREKRIKGQSEQLSPFPLSRD